MILFGIDTALLAVKAFTLTALTFCPVKPPPQVDVFFTAEKPYWNTSYGSTALRNSMQADKESTVQTDKREKLLGVTTSKIDSKFEVNFHALTDRSGNQCLYVNRATFIISYYPAIFIAKEVKGLTCKEKVVHDHENQHVAIDLKTIQEYLPRIKMDMLLYLQTLGYQGFGPYNQSESLANRERLLKQIMAASLPMVEKLRESRRQRQGIIDTSDNYMRESEKCPEEQNMLRHRLYSAQ